MYYLVLFPLAAIIGTIAIVVTITIAVTSSCTFRSVQYHGEVLEAFPGVHGFQFGKHGAVQQAGTNHEDGAVRQLLDDLCIGHDVDGWAIDEDVIVFRSQSRYQCRQFAVFQQLGRIGRYCSDGDDMQVSVFLVGDDDFSPIFNPVAQIVA